MPSSRTGCVLAMACALTVAPDTAAAPEDRPVRLQLGVGPSLGTTGWGGLGISATGAYVLSSRIFVGLHSAVELGTSEDDDPVDRLQHHGIDAGYLLHVEPLTVSLFAHGGALLFHSGREEPGDFATPFVGPGVAVLWEGDVVHGGVDARLVIPFRNVDRGDESIGLTGMPVQAVFGASF